MSERRPSPEEIQFHKVLLQLASHCKYTMKRNEIEAIDHLAQPIGYVQATEKLWRLGSATQPGSRFPSQDIFEKTFANATLSDESASEDVAARICTAVSRFGRNWTDTYTFRQPDATDFTHAMIIHLGEVGEKVVDRMGGWLSICDQGFMASDLKILRPQLKRMALSILEQARLGVINSPLQLPKPKSAFNPPSELERANPLGLLEQFKPKESK